MGKDFVLLTSGQILTYKAFGDDPAPPTTIPGVLIPYGSFLYGDSKDRDYAFWPREWGIPEAVKDRAIEVELPVFTAEEGSREHLFRFLKDQGVDTERLDLVAPALFQNWGGWFESWERLNVGGASFFGGPWCCEHFASPSAIAALNLVKDYKTTEFVKILGRVHGEEERLLRAKGYWLGVLEQNVLRYHKEVQDEISTTSMFKLLFALVQFEAFATTPTNGDYLDWGRLVFPNTKAEIYEWLKNTGRERLATAFHLAWKQGDYSKLREIAKEVYDRDLPDELAADYEIERTTYVTSIVRRH